MPGIQTASFDGPVPEMGNLGVLRAVFALVGLTDVGAVLVFLWRPRSSSKNAIPMAPALLFEKRHSDGARAWWEVSLSLQSSRWDELTALEARHMEETGGGYG